jgi:hypothetical protein
MTRALPSTAVAVAAAALLLIGGPASLAGQGVPGMRATWGDLQTWARPVEGTTNITHGLGLQVSGGGGTMFLAFEGDVALRQPQPVRSVGVMAAAPFTSNPNLLRPAVLSLLVTNIKKERKTFDLSSRMTVDNPAPGAMVSNGVLTMRADEFVEVMSAETVTGNIFGVDIALRPDQVKAVRALGERLGLRAKIEPVK